MDPNRPNTPPESPEPRVSRNEMSALGIPFGQDGFPSNQFMQYINSQPRLRPADQLRRPDFYPGMVNPFSLRILLSLVNLQLLLAKPQPLSAKLNLLLVNFRLRLVNFKLLLGNFNPLLVNLKAPLKAKVKVEVEEEGKGEVGVEVGVEVEVKAKVKAKAC
ncbi:hypothetical protein PG995_014516 [Apiospora arundinis]